ncbi:MAG: hypothetical protein RIS34_1444 [Pseudomonadota bacterium]|jgi:cytoskeletal protein CcmA (bactofilin family)
MTLQTPFFGKRPVDTVTPRASGATTGLSAIHTSGNPTPGPAPSVAPVVASAPSPAPMKESASKLIVGPNIKLKGVEITDCDTLVVEGMVEATMDSRVMHIAESGAFKGSAEIDIAEIHGEFQGNLTVRQKLVIYATGKVTGKIRYGKVVIEEGGQLMGDIQFGAANDPRALTTPKSGLLAAA